VKRIILYQNSNSDSVDLIKDVTDPKSGNYNAMFRPAKNLLPKLDALFAFAKITNNTNTHIRMLWSNAIEVTDDFDFVRFI
jgi:hypothetical protein